YLFDDDRCGPRRHPSGDEELLVRFDGIARRLQTMDWPSAPPGLRERCRERCWEQLSLLATRQAPDVGSVRDATKEAVLTDQAQSATGELMQLAEGKDFDAVLARFRSHPPAEVLAVADRLREDDIYNVAIELYKWLLEQGESADAHF